MGEIHTQKSAPQERPSQTLEVSLGNVEELHEYIFKQSSLRFDVIPTFQEWKEPLKLISQPIPAPEKMKGVGLSEILMQKRYADLVTQQAKLQEHLQLRGIGQTILKEIQAMLEMKRQRKKVPPERLKAIRLESEEDLEEASRQYERASNDLRKGILNSIATYTAEYAEYRFLHSAGAEQRYQLPRFLVPHVMLSERAGLLNTGVPFILQLQYDVAANEGITEKPTDIDQGDLLTLALKNRLTWTHALAYGKATDALQKEEVCKRFLRACGLESEQQIAQYMSAAKLLLGYLKKHEEAIRTIASFENIPEEYFTLEEALEASTRDSSMLLYIQKWIENGGSLDIKELADIFKESIEKAAAGKQMHIVLFPASPFAVGEQHERKKIEDLSDSDKMRHKADSEKVTQFVMGPEGKIKVENLPNNYGALLPSQQFMLEQICKEITNEDTFEKFCTLMTHDPHGLLAETVDWGLDKTIGDLTEQTKIALKEIVLQEKLSAREAFELYYLMHSSEGKGGFALKLRLIELLKKHGKVSIASQWNKTVNSAIGNAVFDLTWEGIEGAPEYLRKFGLDEEQIAEVKNIALFAKDTGIEKGYVLFVATLRQWAEDPGLWSIIAAVLGVSLAAKILKPGAAAVDSYYIARIALPKLKGFKVGKPGDIVADLKAKGITVTAERIQSVQAEVTKLLDQRKEFTINVFRRIQRIRRANLLRRNAGSSLDELASTMYEPRTRSTTSRLGRWARRMLGLTYYENPVDVAEYMKRIAPNDVLGAKKALESIGLSSDEALLAMRKAGYSDSQLNMAAGREGALLVDAEQQFDEMVQSRIRDVQKNALEIQEELRRIEKMTNRDEIVEARRALRKRVSIFMDDLSSLERTYYLPGLRTELAQSILDDLGIEKLPASFWDDVLRAHEIPLDEIGKKWDVIMESLEKVEGLDKATKHKIGKRLLQSGIMGEAVKVEIQEGGGRPAFTIIDREGNRITPGEQPESPSKAGAEVVSELDSRVATQVERLMKEQIIAEAIQRSGKDAKVVEAMLGKLSAGDLAEVAKSTGAQRLIAGAIESGDEAEMLRIMRATGGASRIAKAFGAGLGTVGIVGDVFSLSVAISDFQSYTDKIEATQTSNPELAKFYSQCKLLCVTEGAASIAGISIQGVAFLGSLAEGGTMVAALGTPAGLIALPIAAAATFVSLSRRGLQESVEYHSMNEEEMKLFTPGRLLSEVEKTNPYGNLNWTQNFFISDLAPEANESTRVQAYGAYFAQIAREKVLPYTDEDLTEEDRQMLNERFSDSRRKEATGQLLKEKLNFGHRTFVTHAYLYVKSVAPDLTAVGHDILKKAEAFGRLQEIRVRKGLKPLHIDDREVAASIEKTIDIDSQAATQSILGIKNEFILARTLFQEFRHELALAESKILSADYSNWGKTAWMNLDFGDEDSMQKITRGYVLEEVWFVLSKLASHKDGMAAMDISTARDALHAVLDPILSSKEGTASISLQAIERKAHYSPAAYLRAGQYVTALTTESMMKHINNYRLTKPESAGSTPFDAVPIVTNFSYYYSKERQERQPVGLRIPMGRESGFIDIGIDKWMQVDDAKDLTKVSGVIELKPSHRYRFWDIYAWKPKTPEGEEDNPHILGRNKEIKQYQGETSEEFAERQAEENRKQDEAKRKQAEDAKGRTEDEDKQSIQAGQRPCDYDICT